MKAAGGELGWLTWPLDQGDKSGVSITVASPPSPTLITCLRINVHEKMQGKDSAELRSSCAKYLTIPLVWLAFQWASGVYVSGFYKMWQLEPNGCLCVHMERSCRILTGAACRACLGYTEA